ncbi:MAG: tryptophan synthase subunit alpha [Lachnospiraceae bacterium]|jgi:tryptophan synthase alpha chain|nr:tryptophan synthase subunit alpha [Lachnospiraceae bacterium]
MSRISEAFAHGKAFIPFITAGYPDLETTRSVVKAAQENGADLIEIGIPFSDPTAEGAVIQNANVAALEGGVTTDQVLDFVKGLRDNDGITVPMVFMTYANVIYSYHEGGDGPIDGASGEDRGRYGFCRRCAEAGIDGLILPDVPFEEKEEFRQACRAAGIDLISLIAPTSEERIDMIASDADGFIYVVSSLGVTGVRTKITTDIGAITDRIRSVTDVPCAVGFGISAPEQAAAMAALSDGAIVGSAIIKIIGKYGKNAAPEVGKYIRSMKDAVRNIS